VGFCPESRFCRPKRADITWANITCLCQRTSKRANQGRSPQAVRAICRRRSSRWSCCDALPSSRNCSLHALYRRPTTALHCYPDSLSSLPELSFLPHRNVDSTSKIRKRSAKWRSDETISSNVRSSSVLGWLLDRKTRSLRADDTKTIQPDEKHSNRGARNSLESDL